MAFPEEVIYTCSVIDDGDDDIVENEVGETFLLVSGMNQFWPFRKAAGYLRFHGEVECREVMGFVMRRCSLLP